MAEYVLQIDFTDRPGLGYEILKLTEQESLAKIAMEVLPGQGMVIKLHCLIKEQADRLIASLQNITGVRAVRLRDQMPHEEREEELKTILHSVSEGVLAVNREGDFTHVNEVACRLFDCTAQAVTGKAATMLLAEGHPLLVTLQTGQPCFLQEQCLKRGGKIIRYLISTKAVRNDKQQVIGSVATITDFHQVEEIISRAESLRHLTAFDEIIYQSEKMRHLIDAAKTVAKSTSTILLCGESGTGKELFANAIHAEGPRHKAPFIAVNCTALPDSLLESELFGYEEGSFTGAIKGGKKGLFEQANGGTLFLDEVGEVSTQVQVRLLRVLQEGTIRRIGGHREICLDVRIIAATHRRLEELVRRGEFREDLYYRLNVIPLTIPPLRERREDIVLIAQHLIRKICRKLDKSEVRLTKASMAILQEQEWPGNIRQLSNQMERLINLVAASEITPEHLALWGDAEKEDGVKALLLPQQIQINFSSERKWPHLKTLVAQVEKTLLKEVLQNYPSSRQAGQVLGVSNTTILNKMHLYGLIPSGSKEV